MFFWLFHVPSFYVETRSWATTALVLGSFLLPGLRHASKVFTLRSLMQPGGDAEQQSLRYLRQQGQPAS